MVKSKKKYNTGSRHSIKSRKNAQRGGDLGAYSSFAPVSLGSDKTTESLKSIEKLQDTTNQSSLIISYVQASRYGTPTGASSYITIKDTLKSIRKDNIDTMDNISKILSNPSPTVQRQAFKEIRSLKKKVNTYKFQKIIQSKRDVESSFKNVKPQRKPEKSELFNSVSNRVHLVRSKILLDLATLVREETQKINILLSEVVNDKTDDSFDRDADSTR